MTGRELLALLAALPDAELDRIVTMACAESDGPLGTVELVEPEPEPEPGYWPHHWPYTKQRIEMGRGSVHKCDYPP